MKRFLAILLSLLLISALSSTLAEENTAGFSLPELYRTISIQPDHDQLPADFPEKAAFITAASFSGTSLSVELNTPVPSLAILQYTDDGDIIVRASAEKASSLSADNLDASQGMADVIMTWELSGGILTGSWTIWGDNSFAFLQCQYIAQAESERYTPYFAEKQVIELDQQLQVLSDTRILSNDMDSFTLNLEYDTAGKLADYSCEWQQGSDGTRFFIRSSAEGIPSGISLHNATADFIAVADNLDDYLNDNGIVLNTVDYDIDFTSALRSTYPQVPEPKEDYPIAMAPSTPSDLADTNIQGSLWCLGFGPEETLTYIPFVTADPLFLFTENTVSLNTQTRDINGTLPDFASRLPDFPVFELPTVQ